jgi:two-component system cell cycle response regulator
MGSERHVVIYLDRLLVLDAAKTVSIGRDASCDIVLPHRTVSRSHAVIEWKDDVFVLRDAGSTNGTFLDDERIDESPLSDRDRIRIGVYVLEYRIVGIDTIESGDIRTPDGTMVLEAEFAKLVREASDPALAAEILSLKKLVSRKNRRMSDLVNRDGLTGLFNRRFFDRALRAEFERAARYGRKLAFIMIDIDHFKLINDGHGHAKGDDVLREVARVVEKVTRKNDIAARYGGEELCVIGPETSLAGGRSLAEKIRKDVRDRVLRGTGILVTVSAGVAARGIANNTPARLIDAADRALYRAKETGRDRVCTDAAL